MRKCTREPSYRGVLNRHLGCYNLTRQGLILVAIAVIVVMVIATSIVLRQQPSPEEPTTPAAEEELVALSIHSSAFDDGDSIPQKYTCDGEDISPPLLWMGAPNGTETFTLIVDDPDAPLGVFTHWVLFNLPEDVEALPEGVPRLGTLEFGGVQGMNDFGNIGYGGPCPPPGKPHEYRFHLYALDTDLKLVEGASKQDLLKAMDDHVLAEAEITGVYGR